MKALVASLCIVLFSSVCWAGEWVDDSLVEAVSVQPNGRIYVQLSSDVPDIGCNFSGKRKVELDTAAPNYKEQFALFMAAQLSAKKVGVYVNECGAYPLAQNTYILSE